MRHHDYYSAGLGEDGGESTLMVPTTPSVVTTTPSGAPTRQGSDVDWGGVINTVLPTLANVYQQRQLTRLNVARINAGQSPITAGEFGASYRVPTAEVQIGATAQTQRLMMFMGLGVAVLVGLRAAKII